MKSTHVLFATATIALAAFASPLATAKPAFRQQLIQQFGLAADKDGKPSVTCAYCHMADMKGWNKYGELVRAQLKGDAKGSIGEALYLSLKADKDSDEDGYEDELEVFAGTLPGDATSKPLVDSAALHDRFEKAGGSDAYKPKK